jgi:polyhydroxyalkanoate synthesis repressor PhaR
MLIKKYGNRRLYDTESSCYITLEDLTARIRDGAEVKVVDAKTGADLTQSTLTQIIIEGRGADRLLPAPLLHQLIRLGDDVLADFLGRYVQGALELYLQAKKTSQTLMPFNPFAQLAAFMAGSPSYGGWSQPQPMLPQSPPVSPEVDSLRRELDALKRSLRRRRKEAK